MTRKMKRRNEKKMKRRNEKKRRILYKEGTTLKHKERGIETLRKI